MGSLRALDVATRDLLDSLGWVAVPGISWQGALDIAGCLGDVGNVTRLTPKQPSAPVAASLSGRHGLAAFPFHTDGASRVLPPAYIVLWSAQSWKTATLLLDGNTDALDVPAFSRSWLVSARGRRSLFYAIPRLRVRGRVSWRLNTDCMFPAPGVLDGDDLHRPFQVAQPVRVQWSAGSAVIIDNRRMLHAREAVATGESHRELLRVEVCDDMVR